MNKYLKYQIKRSDKIIKYNGVQFVVRDNQIIRIINKGKIKSIFIPCVFPSGEKVDSLGPYLCIGKFGRVAISSGISDIETRSFSTAEIEEVIWSEGCKIIPGGCFWSSKIKKVSNISNVIGIGTSAFEKSELKEIDWPSGCSRIPTRCFYKCNLSHIHNLDNVEEIGDFAFSFMENIEKIDLSSSSPFILVGENAFFGIPKENVLLPYYMEKIM